MGLADSYSSGTGANDYDRGDYDRGDYDRNDADCKRSANAYSQRWFKEFSTETVAEFTFVACSGAKTGDGESKQLSALGSDTTMVSMPAPTDGSVGFDAVWPSPGWPGGGWAWRYVDVSTRKDEGSV